MNGKIKTSRENIKGTKAKEENKKVKGRIYKVQIVLRGTIKYMRGELKGTKADEENKRLREKMNGAERRVKMHEVDNGAESAGRKGRK